MFTANNLRKITAIVTAVLGLIAIILGFTLLGEQDTHSTNGQSFGHIATVSDVPGASFGADFYTYMYDASDVMVSELSAINHAASTIIDAQNAIIKNPASTVRAADALANTISKVGGVVTIAIGMAILAYAANCAAVAFVPAEVVAQPELPQEEKIFEE